MSCAAASLPEQRRGGIRFKHFPREGTSRAASMSNASEAASDASRRQRAAKLSEEQPEPEPEPEPTMPLDHSTAEPEGTSAPEAESTSEPEGDVCLCR